MTSLQEMRPGPCDGLPLHSRNEGALRGRQASQGRKGHLSLAQQNCPSARLLRKRFRAAGWISGAVIAPQADATGHGSAAVKKS